jgi:scyllo-inositol 2-dehydrogenase (NADP+)
MSKIRVGIVGLGRAGWGMHVPELGGKEEKFLITAGCDTDAAQRKRFADKCACPVYRRIEDLIADPNVDLVDIASRTTEHVQHAVLALKAGKDVFLEKPIAVSYPEALKLKAAARRSRGTLYIRHNRRFEPGFQHIREIMDSGILGNVYEIKLRRNGYSRRDDWQTLLRCGGGQLLNWGPHIIDHALRFLDAPVAVMWSDLKRISAVGDAEDHLRIILRGQNGRVVDLQISGGAAVSEPEYIVLGTRGGLRSSGNEIVLRYLDPANKLPTRRAKSGMPGQGFGTPDTLKWVEQTIPVAPGSGATMTSIWDHLHASIREGKPFPITLDEALGVMKVVSAARKGTAFEEGLAG